MILHNASDAAYLVVTGARSRAAGYTYLGNDINNRQIIKGLISIIAKIIKRVMSSAAEAEIGALYMSAKQLLPLRETCEKLGHPQPAMPMQIDKNTASGIINVTFNQAKSKAIDTRYYWLMDKAQQKQFRICWDRGIKNLADYFSKQHSGAHHEQVRPIHIKLLGLRAPKLRNLVRLAGVHKQAAAL